MNKTRRNNSRILTEEVDPTKIYEWSKIKQTVDQYQRRQRLKSISSQKQLISQIPKDQLQKQNKSVLGLGGNVTGVSHFANRLQIQQIIQSSLTLSKRLRERNISREDLADFRRTLDDEQIDLIFEQLSPRNLVQLKEILQDDFPEEILEKKLIRLEEEKRLKKCQQDPRRGQKSERLSFYLNEEKAKFCNCYIEEILDWAGDLEKLEVERSYFQYLFPNFQQGEDGIEDARNFRKSYEICDRVFRAYKMMLEYFGIGIEDPATGKLGRLPNYIQRYKKTFLIFQNQSSFKIKKILQFLNIAGFRKYAIQLCKFLHYEIFGINGKHKIVSDKIVILKPPPLASIALCYQQDWEFYGEMITIEKNNPNNNNSNSNNQNQAKQINFLKDNCLFEIQELAENSEFFHDSKPAQLLFPTKVPTVQIFNDDNQEKKKFQTPQNNFRITRSKSSIKTIKSAKP